MNNDSVVVINYVGRKGGGPLDAYEMAKALVEKGEKVIPIISSYIDNRKMWDSIAFEKIIEIDTYNSNIEFLYKTIFFDWIIGRKIKKEISKYRVKASYSPMITFWTNKINKIVNARKTITVCHDPIPHSGQNPLYTIFDRNQYSADIIVVHTKKFLEQTQKRWKKVVYIPLGRHNIYKTIKNKKKCISYNSNTINFLFFGRIEKYKGVDVLIKAFSQLQEKYSNITLTIVGSGKFTEYERSFDALTNKTLINRFVEDREVESIFTGENIISVCPYKDATQSGVVMVSYDYGIPVIASNVGGLDEQIIDGKTGFLINPNDVDELVYAMEKFILDTSLLEKMRSEIVRFIETFSWKHSAEELLKLIN